MGSEPNCLRAHCPLHPGHVQSKQLQISAKARTERMNNPPTISISLRCAISNPFDGNTISGDQSCFQARKLYMRPRLCPSFCSLASNPFRNIAFLFVVSVGLLSWDRDPIQWHVRHSKLSHVVGSPQASSQELMCPVCVLSVSGLSLCGWEFSVGIRF